MKKIISSIIIIFIIFVLPVQSFAAIYGQDDVSVSPPKNSETSSSGDLELGNLDDYKGKQTDSTVFMEKVGIVLGGIRIIGTVVSVVALILIGLKYMLGSVEEKAEYKKTLVPYIVGAFMLFTVTLVPQLIYVFISNI